MKNINLIKWKNLLILIVLLTIIMLFDNSNINEIFLVIISIIIMVYFATFKYYFLKNIKYNIGVVAGCFDVIHPGYIHLFKTAKQKCNKLVILLQDDPTIDRPEKNKPILSINDRITILKSIKYIDTIYCYKTEKDLYDLLKKLKPNIRFLGDDYINKTINGSDLNIKIEYISREHNWSSSKFKKLIFENLKNNNNN